MERFIDGFMDRAEQAFFAAVTLLFFFGSVFIPTYIVVFLHVNGMGSGWLFVGNVCFIVVACIVGILMFFIGWLMVKAMVPYRFRQWSLRKFRA